MYSQNSLNVLALDDTKVNLFHMGEFQRDAENKQQIEHTRNDNLNNLLEKFYDTETLGINGNPDIIKEFEMDLEFNGDRYICKLPLKQYRETIPDNYGNTFKRLKYLLNKLKKDTQLYTAYDAIIKECISDGIVETVNSSGEEGMVHYLPHRAVIREDKDTTKVRIVFDASSKVGTEPSLNDCLLSGPCLLPSIYDILLRFRMGKIGIVSDIQQAFLNIEIHPEHRDLLRFLWLREIGTDTPEIITLRFTRNTFGLTSSPFLLNGTIGSHLSKYLNTSESDVVSRLQRGLYVDDSVVSVDSVEEGVRFVNVSKEIMEEGGFKLRKWETNDIKLREMIHDEMGQDDCLTYAKEELGDSQIYRKVLGLNWDTVTDDIVFEVSRFGVNGLSLHATKRNILRISASYFDLIGLICPVVLQAKLFFKEICNIRSDWQAPVTEEISQKWLMHLNDLKSCDDIRVPRFIFDYVTHKSDHVELHGFADSSKDAGAAVVYIRYVTLSGVIFSKIVTAKSKIANSKITSIPRLELNSSVILSKLICTVKKTSSAVTLIKRVTCWSDSEVALYWIKGIRREWKPWVENRLTIIRNNVGVNFWRYVPTQMNPADLATREGRINDLLNEKWWFGPKFLQGLESAWPSQKPFTKHDSPEVLNEKRKNATKIQGTIIHLVDAVVPEPVIKMDDIIDPKRFNSFEKLCCVTSYVLRFIRNLKKENCSETYEPSVEEINDAQNLWLKCVQDSFYENDKYKQLSSSLRLFKDEFSLLRSKTRLGEATDIEMGAKFPVVLPGGHHVVEIIIMDAHREVLHAGADSTLNRIRSKFWIINGRQTVRKVLRNCVLCKQWRLKRLKAAPIANLPSYRICSEYPFQSTGLDFAGPLFVKNTHGDSEKLFKCYILLFTCATTRAIHLELTPDMSTLAVIRAIQRFIYRKGYPRRFISDNFKSFKSSELKNFLRKHLIEWRFILELSPWWGGFYERLVKIVKSTLQKMLRNAKLSYEELVTVLTGVECMINSRPLTYLSDENVEAITPFHLLHGRNIAVRGDRIIHRYENHLGKNNENRIKSFQSLLAQYWNRFYHEYVYALRERMLYDKEKRAVANVIVGDVVMIIEENVKSIHWKKGRIIEVISGRDAMIRGVKLQSTSPAGKMVKISRPLQRIIPLEIALADDKYDSENINMSNDDSNDFSIPKVDKIINNEIMIDNAEIGVEDNLELNFVRETYPKRKVAVTGEVKRRFAV